MTERQADPIPAQAIKDLVQRMIAEGRPIEEQCRVEITPPYTIQRDATGSTIVGLSSSIRVAIQWKPEADHKDTTEPHE